MTNPPHYYQGHTPSFPPHGTISDFLHPIAEGLDPDRGQPYKGHHDLRHAKRGQTYQEHRQRVNLHQGGALQAVTRGDGREEAYGTLKEEGEGGGVQEEEGRAPEI